MINAVNLIKASACNNQVSVWFYPFISAVTKPKWKAVEVELPRRERQGRRPPRSGRDRDRLRSAPIPPRRARQIGERDGSLEREAAESNKENHPQTTARGKQFFWF